MPRFLRESCFTRFVVSEKRITDDRMVRGIAALALQLRNPHSILAAFRERPGAVIDVRLPAGRVSEAWDEVERLARLHRVPVVPAAMRAERMSRRNQRDESGGRAGAAAATVKERPDISLEDLFGSVSESSSLPADKSSRESDHRLWLALDQVQDPHNVGAIFRTAAFFGIAGLIVTRDRSAPINATVYDVASGGVETVPFACPPNLSRALDVAKKAGLWVLGASEHAERDVRQIPRDRSWLLVLGNEEKGLRRLTSDLCDETCRLTPTGPIGSLNVSVAAGILMAALTSKSFAS